MNILFVAENYPPHMGGAEVVFKNMCEGLAKQGHEVTIITHHITNTKRKETKNGVSIIRVPCFGNRYLFTFMASFWAFKYAKKADIIHTTTYNGAPPAWLAAKVNSKPVCITVHETWLGQWEKFTNMPKWKAALHEILERPIWWLPFDKYLPVSKSTKKQLENILPKQAHKKITVLYNGFDDNMWKKATASQREQIRKKYNIKKNDFLVFAYGRPGVSKGMEFYAQAASTIQKEITNAKIMIALSGNKHTKKAREKIIATLPKDAIVITALKHEEKPKYVKAADCVVIPSLCEGFGYTTLEVGATGTPFVATKAGSIPEVVGGKHILITPKSKESIAKGVSQIKKKKFIEKPLKKWPWKIKKLEKIYLELI